ncbi:uncharacterized protein LOC116141548 [Pistacia vera]|uniref:uncharacterized protein LOC116141548 n=1 Tax=Pistacia vera TaxID=55513 RepID=UPI001262C51A|nr:uncharacterized protein LOC116141548 [Pistacia vera]
MVASSSRVTGILRDSIKIPAKNGKLIFQLMPLILCPFYLLVLLHDFTAGPLEAKVEDGYERGELNQKDVGALVGVELLFMAAFLIIFLFEMMVTIFYASDLAYNTAGSSMKVMDLMLRIKSTWTKPLITWLYVSFLTIIYTVFVLITIRLISLIVWKGLAAILAIILYLYVAQIWGLGLVISAVERDCKGGTAVKRARKLLEGRKLEGFFIMLILFLLSVPIYILFYVTLTDDDDELGVIAQIAFGFVATLLFCVVTFFSFVVFTLFYHECKQSYGEKLDMEMKSGAGCSLVSQKC